MTGKDVYLQMTWSWPDKTWNILCSYCLQWNTSQSKFRNHYFLFLFAFSIPSQLFLIWGCRCFLAQSNIAFLFLNVSSGLHLVVNPLYLHSWRRPLIVDFDNDVPTSSRVFLISGDVMKGFFFTKERILPSFTDLSCSPNFCLFVDHKVQSRWGKLGCRLYSKRRHYGTVYSGRSPSHDANSRLLWSEFHARMKRVNSKCSSVQLRANSAIYSRKSRLVWTHSQKKIKT